MGTGKEYRKEDQALRGAALFYLALERNGGERIGGANEIIKATFRDLGVTLPEVESYIEKHRDTLVELLSKRKA